MSHLQVKSECSGRHHITQCPDSRGQGPPLTGWGLGAGASRSPSPALSPAPLPAVPYSLSGHFAEQSRAKQNPCGLPDGKCLSSGMLADSLPHPALGQTRPSLLGPLRVPPCVSVCPVNARPGRLGSLCVPSRTEHGIP